MTTLHSKRKKLVSQRAETVTRVIDGDTFLTASRRAPIRLMGHNAPERGEKGFFPYRRKLQRLIEHKRVTVRPIRMDIYGSIIAEVKVGSRSVSDLMKKAYSPRHRVLSGTKHHHRIIRKK